MTKLIVRKYEPEELGALTFLDEMDQLMELVRRRAFGLFEDRGCVPGSEMEDWLRAERELVWSPRSELINEEEQFRLRLAVPGLEERELQVTAMRDGIVVQSESTQEKSSKTAEFSEFSNKKLFRRFELSEVINPDKVQATLDRGILEIIAPKAAPAKQFKVAVQGA